MKPIAIEPSWNPIISQECNQEYFRILREFVYSEYAHHTVYPKPKDIFQAFNLCPFDTVKVIIIGQDPYHNPRQAMGLSFSVPSQITIPPSLRNIFREIESDLGIQSTENGDLTRWAKQGVLLLNATLTVRAHQAGSHQKRGWEQFTDSVIQKISQEKEHCVFLLWGNFAKQKSGLLDPTKHLILTAQHPSPFSAHRGFFGCKHFSQANQYLIDHGISPINWN